MNSTVLSPRDFIKWFVKQHTIDGQEMTFVTTNSGRKIDLSNMTDDDAEFVAGEFMSMMATAKDRMQ